MHLAPVGKAQKAAVIQRKFLASHGQGHSFMLVPVRPSKETLVEFYAPRVQDGREIGSILRRQERHAVVGGAGDEHPFALREYGEPFPGGSFVAKRHPQSGRKGGPGKWRAVAFEPLEAISGGKR